MKRFNVTKMNCGGCAGRIAKAIQAIDPAAEVHADIPKRELSVVSQLTTEVLLQQLASIGYESNPLDTSGTISSHQLLDVSETQP